MGHRPTAHVGTHQLPRRLHVPSGDDTAVRERSREAAIREVAQACPHIQYLKLTAYNPSGPFASMAFKRLYSRSLSQLSSLTLDWESQNVDALMNVLHTRFPETHAVAKLKKLHLCKIQDADELHEGIPAIDNMLQLNKHFILSFTLHSASAAAAISARESRLLVYNNASVHPS